MFEPTLDAIEARGLSLTEIDTMHLDRGYDATGVREMCADRHLHDLVIAKKRRRGQAKGEDAAKGTGDKPPLGLGLRWAVERSNSWFSNFGQLRRNTDRRTIHRLAQIALAVAHILTVKLVKWAQRWNRPAAT